VLAAFIIRAITTLMMEAASTSETSVTFYQTTRRNNSGDLHSCHHDNLKSLCVQIAPILQDLIPEVISSQKCHMNMGPILSGYEATDI
jgi:hypothetical protein